MFISSSAFLISLFTSLISPFPSYSSHLPLPPFPDSLRLSTLTYPFMKWHAPEHTVRFACTPGSSSSPATSRMHRYPHSTHVEGHNIMSCAYGKIQAREGIGVPGKKCRERKAYCSGKGTEVGRVYYRERKAYCRGEGSSKGFDQLGKICSVPFYSPRD